MCLLGETSAEVDGANDPWSSLSARWNAAELWHSRVRFPSLQQDLQREVIPGRLRETS